MWGTNPVAVVLHGQYVGQLGTCTVAVPELLPDQGVKARVPEPLVRIGGLVWDTKSRFSPSPFGHLRNRGPQVRRVIDLHKRNPMSTVLVSTVLVSTVLMSTVLMGGER